MAMTHLDSIKNIAKKSNKNRYLATYLEETLQWIAMDGIFNVDDPLDNGGDVLELKPVGGAVGKGSAVLRNVPAGTTITLVASNLGSPEIQPIDVAAWNIHIFELNCNE